MGGGGDMLLRFPPIFLGYGSFRLVMISKNSSSGFVSLGFFVLSSLTVLDVLPL